MMTSLDISSYVRIPSCITVLYAVLVILLCSQPCHGNVLMTSLTMHGSGNLTKGVGSRITCNTQGQPPPLISWSLGDSGIFQGIHVEIVPLPGDNNNVTNTLLFTPRCEHNGKILTCTANQTANINGPLSRSILLSVTDSSGSVTECAVSPPSLVTISPSSLDVTSGQPITASCSSPTTGVNYEWLHNGVTISYSATLFIASASASSTGTYTCKVSNSAGSSSAAINITVISPSSVRISPSAVNVTLGDPVSVSCSSDITSGVTYQWLYKGAVIKTSQTLQIQSTAKADDGVYTCIVTHSGGSNSATVDINVQYAPVLTRNAINMESTSRTTLQLSCDNDANPPAISYEWTYNGSSHTGSSSTYQVVMGISNVTVTCKASNGIGTSGTATFFIKYVPDPNTVSVSPSAVNVTQGDPISVSCSSDITSGLTYQWLYNGTVIGTSATLQIQSIAKADDGVYTCIVTHSGGSNSATVDINVQYAPVLTRNTMNMESTSGTTLQLSCHNNANPPATSYEWTYNGSSYTGSNSTYQVVMGISNVTVTCKASNGIGSSGTATFFITYVPDPNTVSISASAVNVTLGDPVSVSCLSDITSSVAYQWLYKGAVIGTSATLQIHSTAKADDGVYTCIVTHLGESNSATVDINIQYSPVLTRKSINIESTNGTTLQLNCQNDANPPATSYEWIYNGESHTGSSSTYQVVMGTTDVTVTCKASNGLGTSETATFSITYASGLPSVSVSPSALNVTVGNTIIASCRSNKDDVTYKWIYNGAIVGSSSTLRIQSAVKSNDGVYICMVTNSGGSNAASVDINVQYSPIITRNTTNMESSSGTALELNCQNDANPPASSYVWTYNGNTYTRSCSTYQVVMGDTDLTVHCQASNSIGSSETAMFYIKTARPGVTVTTAKINATSGDTIKATCSSDRDDVIYKWEHNGVIVGTSATLTIPSASKSDNGSYICTVTANSGESSSAMVDINVWYAPVVTTNLVNIKATTGETLNLNCLNDANPRATSYIWTYNGTSYTTRSSSFPVTMGGNNLEVHCKAVNSIGLSGTAVFNITRDTTGSGGTASGLALESSLGGVEIAAISMGVLLLLVLILLLLLCCCCCGTCHACCARRKGDKRKTHPFITTDKEIMYAIKIPRFHEIPTWTLSESYHRKSNCLVSPFDEIKAGPIISIYDDHQEKPDAFYLNAEKYILLNKEHKIKSYASEYQC